MQTINVRTTQNVVIQYHLAGIGDRILAQLIDASIITLYTILAWILLFYAVAKFQVDTFWVALFAGIIAIPIVFYHFLFEVFMDCQTPGKRAVDIKIVRLDGAHPTIGNHFLRWLCRILDIGPIGIILIAATEKSQRLGDMAADTTVVKIIKQREITASDIFIAPESSYAPVFPQVTQLEPKDIELIQRALEANKNFGNHKPVIVITEKIKSLLGIQTDLSPAEFLYTLVKDYNHLTAR
jgi:uncharacterized RDD family membrane protein YckC